jgi:ABC-type Mn2+/Zn2+ transport system ATPase subunit
MSHPVHDIIRCSHVTVRYGARLALDDVTASIPCGTATAILGPNGAGKSTLLRALLGWHNIQNRGEIRIGDTHAHHQLPRLAYLPQRHAIDWDFPITVRAVVAQGRYPSLRPWQRLRASDHAAIERALGELGIHDLADRQIRMLSGGQQQRVFLARAVAQGADIFLLDEPFGGLDLFATEELTHILRSWVAQGRTVLAAVHDLALARAHFSHALLLNTRLVASGLIADVLTEDRINDAYRGGRCLHEHANPLRGVTTTDFPA